MFTYLLVASHLTFVRNRWTKYSWVDLILFSISSNEELDFEYLAAEINKIPSKKLHAIHAIYNITLTHLFNNPKACVSSKKYGKNNQKFEKHTHIHLFLLKANTIFRSIKIIYTCVRD